MGKDNIQLELFSEAKSFDRLKTATTHTFFSYIRNYEKLVLLIIGFIVTGIVSFSLGIEKGKRIAISKSNSQITTQAPSTVAAEEPKVFKPPRPEHKTNYTIQVATFQTKKYAEKEAEALRKKGFVPLFVSRDRYTLVCVGEFVNPDAARSLLTELKKKYRDCFIKRM